MSLVSLLFVLGLSFFWGWTVASWKAEKKIEDLETRHEKAMDEVVSSNLDLVNKIVDVKRRNSVGRTS